MNTTEALSRVLMKAGDLAGGTGYCGTEHVLMALLREDVCIARTVLSDIGVTERKVKSRLKRLGLTPC